MTNCPNCGATITGAKCEYCGTVFEKNNDVKVEVVTDCLDSGIITDIQRYLNLERRQTGFEQIS